MGRIRPPLAILADLDVGNFPTGLKLSAFGANGLVINMREPADCPVRPLGLRREQLVHYFGFLRLRQMPPVQVCRSDERYGVLAVILDRLRLDPNLQAGGVPVPPVENLAFEKHYRLLLLMLSDVGDQLGKLVVGHHREQIGVRVSREPLTLARVLDHRAAPLMRATSPGSGLRRILRKQRRGSAAGGFRMKASAAAMLCFEPQALEINNFVHPARERFSPLTHKMAHLRRPFLSVHELQGNELRFASYRRADNMLVYSQLTILMVAFISEWSIDEAHRIVRADIIVNCLRQQ
jgi:hypothetical protein